MKIDDIEGVFLQKNSAIFVLKRKRGAEEIGGNVWGDDRQSKGGQC
jgi:hypothetical protein